MDDGSRKAAWELDPGFISRDLLDKGFTTLILSDEDREVFKEMRSEAYWFFQRDSASKMRHLSPDFNFGFRPFGRQYSITPERPDVNESFAYWSDSVALIPESSLIERFIAAMEAYRHVVVRVTHTALQALANYYSYNRTIEFENTSCIEANWYLPSDTRELLQDRHEDGHLLTVLTADGPGLEIEVDGEMRPKEFQDGELLLMPGALLTDMSGGAIPPLFHRVRNHRRPTRLSLLYEVNPNANRGVEPFIVNNYNRHTDIAARARRIGQSFGLPQAPIS